MTKYTAASGALVVGTGTNHWNWGLAQQRRREGTPERRIRQATTNVLFDMGAFPETPASDLVLDDPSAPPRHHPAHARRRTRRTSIRRRRSASASRGRWTRPRSPPRASRSRGPTGPLCPRRWPTTTPPSRRRSRRTRRSSSNDSVHRAARVHDVRAANGIALGRPVRWSFTTRPPDPIAPTVSDHAPGRRRADREERLDHRHRERGGQRRGRRVQFRLDGHNLGTRTRPRRTRCAGTRPRRQRRQPQLTAVAPTPRTTRRPRRPSRSPSTRPARAGARLRGGDRDRGGRPLRQEQRRHARRRDPAPTSGRFGRALSFDGINDWVTVADAASLDLTNAMTLEAWVNPARRPLAHGDDEGAAGRLVYALYANNDQTRPSAHVYTTREYRQPRHRRRSR